MQIMVPLPVTVKTLLQLALDDEEITDYFQLESLLRTTVPGTTVRFYLLDNLKVCIIGFATFPQSYCLL